MFRVLVIFLILTNDYYKCCASPLASTCVEKVTCDDCISIGCTWCKELRDPGSQIPRCNTPQNHRNNRCPQKDIVKAESFRNITLDQPLSKEMRITPQNVVATLGVGEKVTVDLKYNDNEDKPLDLYYIMDLSATMKDDKDTVSKQASNMVRALQKITKKVRLGFGAFIDKPVLPFTRAAQLWKNTEYDIPYGFRNWLSLTTKIGMFQETVRKARISQNLDLPEGTLDALMQAITCTDEIGWQNSSRKLIVVATDGIFHIAGDGKIVGIIRPNDMKCHMENGLYTHSTKLDYPTIGELNHVIFEHKVYVIFAVSTSDSEDAIKMYRELQKHISQSSVVLLQSDSGDLVRNIKQKYQELSSTVRLNVEKAPPNVMITVEAKCPNNKLYYGQDYCSNVNLGTEISFKINLELKECPTDENYNVENDKIIVSFFELSDREKLEIKLKYNCKCASCNDEIIEHPVHLERYCSGPEASDYISCGSCRCKEGRYGDSCQCSTSEGSNQVDQSNCIDPNSQGQQTCSNRGHCKCGKCVCVSGFNGRYCEDSTADCQNRNTRFPTKLCSDLGHCIKGKCNCTSEGYEGKYCECESFKKSSCVEPGKSLTDLCNGHGECVCQEGNAPAYCKCDSNYGGRYCGVCKINCPPSGDKVGTRCGDKFIQECIKCRVRHFNDLDADQSNRQCLSKCATQPREARQLDNKKRKDISNYEFVAFTGPESLDDKYSEGTECRLQLNSSCTIKFKYEYKHSQAREDDTLVIYYKPKEVACEREPPFIWFIFATILGVLLAGILGLLIWKLATYMHDRREYQRFVKETSQAKWQTSENPLYNKPMSEFSNPAYRE